MQLAFTGAAAVAAARTAAFDAILLAPPLPDTDGLALCRALRQDPSITPSLPIIGIIAATLSREQRLDWLRAGAWDCFGFPLDQEQVLLKLNIYRAAKQEVDRAWEAALVDPATGLYSGRGVARRARELVAEALRLHAALACAVFGAEVRAAAPGTQRAVVGLRAVRAKVGEVLRTHARVSDTVGWWNGAEFAILAPATDANGALKLAQRLAHAIATAAPLSGEAGPGFDIRVGYEAVADVHATPLEPQDLIGRARAALQLARSGEVRRFEPTV